VPKSPQLAHTHPTNLAANNFVEVLYTWRVAESGWDRNSWYCVVGTIAWFRPHMIVNFQHSLPGLVCCSMLLSPARGVPS